MTIIFQTHINDLKHFTDKDLEEINNLEEKEIGGELKRRWDRKEHTLFLEAADLYQGPNKWQKISKYIGSRTPEEVELHSYVLEFQFRSPTRAIFASNSITDFYDFTSNSWSYHEQEIINQEYKRIETNIDQKDENLLYSYFLIASKLKNKSVRDVAFRLRWMRDKHIEKQQQSKPLQLTVSLSPGESIKNSCDKIVVLNPTTGEKETNQLTEEATYDIIKHRLNENEKILRLFQNNLQTNQPQKNLALMEAFKLNCKGIVELLDSLGDMNKGSGWCQMPPLSVEIRKYPSSAVSRALLPASLLDTSQMHSIGRNETRCAINIPNYQNPF